MEDHRQPDLPSGFIKSDRELIKTVMEQDRGQSVKMHCFEIIYTYRFHQFAVQPDRTEECMIHIVIEMIRSGWLFLHLTHQIGF